MTDKELEETFEKMSIDELIGMLDNALDSVNIVYGSVNEENLQRYFKASQFLKENLSDEVEIPLPDNSGPDAICFYDCISFDIDNDKKRKLFAEIMDMFDAVHISTISDGEIRICFMIKDVFTEERRIDE